MRYFVTYTTFDVSVSHKQLGSPETLGYADYQIVSPLDNPAYADCVNISDIEARFERLRNYQLNPDEVTFPRCKIKVLIVEPLEQSWFVRGWDNAEDSA